LIMATPKTDIEQTVGRILRSKHKQPIIIDIVDAHDPYQKQWVKRRAFFKKQDYEIRMINSNHYHTRVDEWKLIYKPKNIGGCEKEEDENDNDNDNKVSTFHFGIDDLQEFVEEDGEESQ